MTTLEKDELVLLEPATRFSQSNIWALQRQYFIDEGIAAWSGAVPFYVTNNMVIATAYAHIAARYLQDQRQQLKKDEPVYIVELGTGSGRFSYLFLNIFTRLVEQLHLQDIKFCYVMTDFTNSNLQFWESHAQLKPFIEQGILDFAIFNLETDDRLHLQHQKIDLMPQSLSNPPIVVGNYIFDTIMHDAFYCKKGVLHEGLLTLKANPSDLRNGKLKKLESLQTEFSTRELTSDFFEDPLLNEILVHYKNNLKESNFLIPTGGINGLNRLRNLNKKGQLLVLAGDKSYTSFQSMENLASPYIAFHGSFSLMVNFDAMARYVQLSGGQARLASDAEGFKINLFCFNQSFDDLPETALAYEEYITRFAMREFLPLKNKIIEHAKSSNEKDLIGLLKLSYWDPDILFSLAEALVSKIGHVSSHLKEEFRRGFNIVRQNYYFIPKSKNVLFELGNLYYVIDALPEAIECYQESMTKFGENAHVWFNLGLCISKQNDPHAALNAFKKALTFDSSNATVKEWIEHTRKLTLQK